MKKLILLFLLMLPLTGIAQSNLRAFLRPVPNDLFPLVVTTDRDITADQRASLWLPRPALTVVANKWWIDKETKNIKSALFSAIAFGLGWQHYEPTSPTDPTPYNDYGFNGLIFIGENVCAGLTFNFNLAGQSMIHMGADYNFAQKRPELLTGVKFEF